MSQLSLTLNGLAKSLLPEGKSSHEQALKAQGISLCTWNLQAAHYRRTRINEKESQLSDELGEAGGFQISESSKAYLQWPRHYPSLEHFPEHVLQTVFPWN